jgi:hypothetical protein
MLDEPPLSSCDNPVLRLVWLWTVTRDFDLDYVQGSRFTSCIEQIM